MNNTQNCPNRAENLKSCACTYVCERKGMCCQCIRHHRVKNQFPACFFPKDAEKTYDRSMEYWVKLWNEGKIQNLY